MNIRIAPVGDDQAKPTPQRRSRRVFLRGASLLGASTAAGIALASTSRPAAALPASGSTTGSMSSHPGSHLTLNYRPSQPTGWGQGFTPTIGGHSTAKEFTFQDTAYRISLILADPVYEDIPCDPMVKFRRTLADSFGAYYSFRYRGGFTARDEFSVESYNVWVSQDGPGILYGADIFVVYDPGHGDPGVQDNLQWIQVINWPQGPPPGLSVDTAGRANPFYIAGGLTSINGNQMVTFADIPQQGVAGASLSDYFLSEVFLARDTGVRDATGKDIVEIFGGLKYGWQVERAGTSAI